jgi:hypothetical protein
VIGTDHRLIPVPIERDLIRASILRNGAGARIRALAMKAMIGSDHPSLDMRQNLPSPAH